MSRLLAELTAKPASIAALECARMLVCDSLICAYAGASLERARMMRSAALDAAGDVEVLGTSLRAPTGVAAMLNAETMNAIDADDTFLNGGHFGALQVAVALAEARRSRATWGAMLDAVLRGFELNAAVYLAVGPQPRAYAAGSTIVGATFTTAALHTHDPHVIANAVGLALRLAPQPLPLAVATDVRSSMKYAPYGAIAASALLATTLASNGYRADADFLSARPGFLHMQGAEQPTIEPLRFDGPRWWIEQTSLKPYPSFRLGHSVLDALKQALAGRRIEPDTIDRIEVALDPRAHTLPFIRKTERVVDDHRAPMFGALNLKYTLALVALGVPPGPRWYEPAVIADERLWRLVERIHFDEEPVCSMAELQVHRDSVTGQILASIACVRVRLSDGMQLEGRVEVCDGDPWSEHTRVTWAWLKRKARNFLGDESLIEFVRGQDDREPMGTLPHPRTPGRRAP
ncbi:MAG: MmgE/PrpD family protein [Steroidobacteraceae bacterium]